MSLMARLVHDYLQDFRFPSFPRRRESSNPLKKLDIRIRGYDEFKGLAKVLYLFSIIDGSHTFQLLRQEIAGP